MNASLEFVIESISGIEIPFDCAYTLQKSGLDKRKRQFILFNR